MIFARRIVAVLLGFAFLAVLLVTLLVLRLGQTFLDSEFYPGQLEKRDLSRFVMADVLPSALDDARAIEADELGIDMSGNPLTVSGLTTAQITESVNRALSPRDLQKISAPVVLRVGQYISSERDSVKVRIKAAEHIREVADELHQLMQESGAYGRILEREVEPRIREAAREALGRNEGVSGWMLYLFGSDEDKLVRAVMEVFTPEWVGLQVEGALDPLIAYLVGESDSFKVGGRITDAQVATAVEQAKSILREVDPYDLVYKGVVEPTLENRLGAETALPYGLTITNDEVLSALRHSAEVGAVQQQAEVLVDKISVYVAGRSDGFFTEISLLRNKHDAAAALTELVGDKVTEAMKALPVCVTESEAKDAMESLRRRMAIACLPPGVTARDIPDEDLLVIRGLVDTMILEAVPDTIIFTQADLRGSLWRAGGPKALGYFDSLRSISSASWYYNDEHLRSDLAGSGNALNVLEGVRTFLADGYTISERSRPRGRLGRMIDEALDGVRGSLSTIRSYQWVAYTAALALLVIIGLLGGTTWRGRVMWMSATLLVSSTIAAILAWPVYDAVAKEIFEHVRGGMEGRFEGPFSNTFLLIATGLADVVRGVVLDFVTGIRLSSLILAGISLTVLLVAVFWNRIITVAKMHSNQLFNR